MRCYYEDQTYYYVRLFIFKGMCIFRAKRNQQCATNEPINVNEWAERTNKSESQWVNDSERREKKWFN